MLSLDQTIVRAHGGGQPADRAWIDIDGIAYAVAGISKSDGRTWLRIPDVSAPPATGSPVRCRIDSGRRRALTRAHSLTHLLMASIRWNFAGYRSRGAEIDENAKDCTLWFDAENLTDSRAAQIDTFARNAIARAVPVNIVTMPSVAEAEKKFRHWRVDPSLVLGGRVRVIEIGEDIDANPCSGTHVTNLSEIGEFTIEGVSPLDEPGGYTLRARIAESLGAT